MFCLQDDEILKQLNAEVNAVTVLVACRLIKQSLPSTIENKVVADVVIGGDFQKVVGYIALKIQCP